MSSATLELIPAISATNSCVIHCGAEEKRFRRGVNCFRIKVRCFRAAWRRFPIKIQQVKRPSFYPKKWHFLPLKEGLFTYRTLIRKQSPLIGKQRTLIRKAQSLRSHSFCRLQGTKKAPHSCEALFNLAATYFPTWCSSIIGDAGLNFSVRNGKRCAPAL